MFEPTILRILFAGLISLIIGVAWYHPRTLGTLWIRYSGITPEDAERGRGVLWIRYPGITPESVERGKKRIYLTALIALLASMLAAYALNMFGIAVGIFDMAGAVKLAALSWAGLVAPALLGSVLWEQRSIFYYLINALYWLVSLIAMSIVLVL
ncbi:MAG: DUF1761 domain-containing protein [bacterium]|nr:DUF1761 domain-containing protein [bacterium]